MTRIKRITLAVLVGVGLIGTAAACAVAPPDEVGLYYMKGDIDGYKFDHCIVPGKSDDGVWNNEVVTVPNSLRTWNIAPQGTPGADSNVPIVVNSAPEEGQPSGVQVSLWPQTNFSLNTSCGTGDLAEKDPNSPLVKWWEKIGHRYWIADQTPGKTEWWKNMLGATIVTALETVSRSVARGYQADVLVSNQKRDEIQQKIEELFQSEIKRLVGGDYFCAPDFDRAVGTCGTVKIQLKDSDYTNQNIQAARDEKQAAIERAAAAVADAKGKVEAAAELEKLYGNEAWVQLQLAEKQLEAVKACAANPNCTIVMPGVGVNVNTK